MCSAKGLLVAATWCLLVWGPPLVRGSFVLGVREDSNDGPDPGAHSWRRPMTDRKSHVWTKAASLTEPSVASPSPPPPLACPPAPPASRHGPDSGGSGPPGRPACKTVSSSTTAVAPLPLSTAESTVQSTPPTTSSAPGTTRARSFSTISGTGSVTQVSFVSSQTGSDLTVTTSLASGSGLSTLLPMSTDRSANYTVAVTDSSSSPGANRTLVIALSTVLSVVGFLAIAGGLVLCCRYRRKRGLLFQRGLSPIDDDEIETWKISRPSEKEDIRPDFAEAGPSAAAAVAIAAGGHSRQVSSGSARRPLASVIVYHSPQPQLSRRSEDFSPRSVASSSVGLARYGRPSLDKDLPQTPTQARAPNSRVGLTDDTVPGDPSYIPNPRRLPSRLSKLPPASSPRSTHTRTRSSRSSASMRSFVYSGSDLELQVSPRESSDFHSSRRSRIYSSSSIPPRLSFGHDSTIGGLSPRPLFRDDIGRAIG